jgi:hypothetical protein
MDQADKEHAAAEKRGGVGVRIASAKVLGAKSTHTASHAVYRDEMDRLGADKAFGPIFTEAREAVIEAEHGALDLRLLWSRGTRTAAAALAPQLEALRPLADQVRAKSAEIGEQAQVTAQRLKDQAGEALRQASDAVGANIPEEVKAAVKNPITATAIKKGKLPVTLIAVGSAITPALPPVGGAIVAVGMMKGQEAVAAVKQAAKDEGMKQGAKVSMRMAWRATKQAVANKVEAIKAGKPTDGDQVVREAEEVVARHRQGEEGSKTLSRFRALRDRATCMIGDLADKAGKPSEPGEPGGE